QQLVKSALLTPERTIQRKIKEIILALWTEQLFAKDQILEMYLNQVPYGGSSYGIEEASKVYFGKHAKELTLEESALLAGLPQAPSVYSPHVNPQLASVRRNEVLKAMKEQKYIDNETMQKAIATDIKTIPPKTAIKAPHFVFYVKSELESLYGIKVVEEGGFRVTTSLDLDIQDESEKILKEELEKIKNLNVTNGAILITRPQTGEILAMVGSVDYFEQPSGAFNVITALRQPGSSIKPVMYSLALQKNYTAATIIDDSPVVFNLSGSESYKPVNYDGKFHGKIPLRYALANSYNVPAVKVLSTIGLQNFISQASKMGITTWRDPSRYGLSLTLGGGEVRVLDMAQAFGVFANAGYKTDLTSFIKVEDVGGSVIREMNTYKVRVLDEGISYIISDILADNFARQWAFGSQSTLVVPGYQVAVKTGTTNDKKDNWTIGYTPDFLVAVWVGNNNNQPMNPYLTSGITGASPIWNRVMSYVLKRYSSGNSWYKKPENLVEKTCYFGRKEYFLKGTEKNASCSEQLFGTTPTPAPNP
ncbi:transglycosylase domain-containing protein, partial [Candidatus Roizmanbacteria bacterium]|nr:transglycosylase domain-containing protein [Candidatus Roizmanbacteria bacterium]